MDSTPHNGGVASLPEHPCNRAGKLVESRKHAYADEFGFVLGHRPNEKLDLLRRCAQRCRFEEEAPDIKTLTFEQGVEQVHCVTSVITQGNKGDLHGGAIILAPPLPIKQNHP